MPLKKYRMDCENLEEDPEYGDVVFVDDIRTAFQNWHAGLVFDKDILRPAISKFYKDITGEELKNHGGPMP